MSDDTTPTVDGEPIRIKRKPPKEEVSETPPEETVADNLVTDEGEEILVYQEIIITRVVVDKGDDVEPEDMVRMTCSESVTLLDGWGMIQFANNMLPKYISDDGV